MQSVTEQPLDQHTPALLFFSLGPVQPYIEKARSVRDLMTGSCLLAWLTSKAIEALPDPSTQLVTPHESQIEFAQAPRLPNRFIAEISDADSQSVSDECRRKCLEAWALLCRTVRSSLQKEIQRVFADRMASGSFEELQPGTQRELELAVTEWDRLWDAQVGSREPLDRARYPFDVHTHLVRIEKNSIERIRQLVMNNRNDPRSWDWFYDLTWSLDAARKATRHIHQYVPVSEQDGSTTRVPAKCTMFGTYEQMGPADTDASRVFWEWIAGDSIHEGVQVKVARVRKRERLCALGLVKRFAWPVVLRRELQSERIEFADTATIAAGEWLELAGHAGCDVLTRASELRGEKGNEKLIWSGQWLHWPHASFDKDERECPSTIFDLIRTAKQLPGIGNIPTYYAILVLDGDKMGEKGREKNGPDAQLNLSALIGRFASQVAEVVQRYRGTLVYAGGDDVLALLPVATVLSCAIELNQKFHHIWRDSEFADSGVSAGIAVAHFKQDLRHVLKLARSAERDTKRNGRDALSLSVCRRSGQFTAAMMDWDFARDHVQHWVNGFRQKNAGTGSDRWAYALAAELPVLEGLDSCDAIRSEIRRLVGRSRASEGTIFKSSRIAVAFDAYHTMWCEPNRQPQDAGFRSLTTEARNQVLRQRAIRGFVTICQTASFLARGRDES